jgi:hypothetical protein
MTPDHPAYEQIRLAVEALCTMPEPIRERLVAADQHLGHIDNDDLRSEAEWNLYHRIGSSLVQGGGEDDAETVADSLAALDDSRVIAIAQDMFHFFELVAEIDPADAPWRWPSP